MTEPSLQIFYNIIHDLKAPLSATTSLIQITQQVNEVSEDQDKHLKYTLYVLRDMRMDVDAFLTVITQRLGEEPDGEIPPSWAERLKSPTSDAELFDMMASDIVANIKVANESLERVPQVGELTEKQNYFIQKAAKSLEQLNTLLAEYREFFEQSAAQRQPNIAPVDVADITQQVIASLDRMARSNQIDIQTQIAPDAQVIQADPALMTTILKNLLNNAIKYSPQEGRVTIISKRVEDKIEISVIDSGFGIPEQDQEAIFQRFYRIDRKASRSSTLGLAAVKTLIERQQGAIRVESTVNQGSTFTLSLPVDSTTPINIHSRSEPPQPQAPDPAAPVPPDESESGEVINFGDVTTDEDETVNFTAVHPQEAIADQWYTLLVYTHLEHLLERVEADAAKFSDEMGDQPRRVKGSRSAQLARGTELTILPEVDGLEFKPAHLTLTWDEDYERAAFRFRADASLIDQAAIGKIYICSGPIALAEINLSIFITDDAPSQDMPQLDAIQSLSISDNPLAQAKMQTSTSTLYNKIFISYSRDDKALAAAYRKAQIAAGNDVFLDTTSIRTGENWQAALAHAIDEADIFQLFWSPKSAASPNVRDEWDYALKHRCPDTACANFIRPVYWHRPMPTPPDELAHLNFRYVAFNQDDEIT